jgi:hypothetical protein
MIPGLSISRMLVLSLGLLALAACSPPADQAETTWHEPPAEVVDDHAGDPDSPGDGRPVLTQFSEDAISAIRTFSDESLMALAEANLACDLLMADELAANFGGDWTEGSFRWFENELQIAPSVLEGICVWQQLEYRTSVTLRVYAASELAWASLLQHDHRFARRFYDRDLAEGPDLGHDAYRKPMGTDGYDGSCVLLDAHIACITASARHTEQWQNNDAQLLGLVAERLSAERD